MFRTRLVILGVLSLVAPTSYASRTVNLSTPATSWLSWARFQTDALNELRSQCEHEIGGHFDAASAQVYKGVTQLSPGPAIVTASCHLPEKAD